MNQIVVVVISFCIFEVAIIAVLKVVEKDRGEYECNTCKHKFELAFREIILSMHSDNTRYLKCPSCNKKHGVRRYKIDYNWWRGFWRLNYEYVNSFYYCIYECVKCFFYWTSSIYFN